MMDENGFIDTQPTNEVEELTAVEGVYNDPTHVPEVDKEITDGVKDDISIKLARWMRQKVYGIDVRETMARFILWMSVLYNRMLALGDKLLGRQDQLEKDFGNLKEQFDEVTSSSTEDLEVIRARTSNHSKTTYKTLGDRLDSMEESHYTYPYGFADSEMTILDNHFSQNHELVKEGTVASDSKLPGLVIAEIDSKEQDTFYLQKVGEV